MFSPGKDNYHYPPPQIRLCSWWDENIHGDYTWEFAVVASQQQEEDDVSKVGILVSFCAATATHGTEE